MVSMAARVWHNKSYNPLIPDSSVADQVTAEPGRDREPDLWTEFSKLRGES